MAVFERLKQSDIHEHFTHYGWMFGLVPVYVGDPEGECRIAVRNYVPEYLMDFAEGFYSAVGMFCQLVNPYYVPMFKVRITGEIQK